MLEKMMLFSRIDMSVRDDGTPSSLQFADLARGASEQNPQDSQDAPRQVAVHRTGEEGHADDPVHHDHDRRKAPELADGRDGRRAAGPEGKDVLGVKSWKRLVSQRELYEGRLRPIKAT